MTLFNGAIETDVKSGIVAHTFNPSTQETEASLVNVESSRKARTTYWNLSQRKKERKQRREAGRQGNWC